MSTIIVYKRTGTNAFSLSAAERQEGMKDAGDLLRDALSEENGSANDTDAEDRVLSVLDELIKAKVTGSLTLLAYDVRLEDDKDSPVLYKLDGQTDNMGRYKLTHPDNLTVNDPNNAPKSDAAQDKKKNGKLLLDVGLDDLAKKKKVFKMRMTVPKSASNPANWIYLTGNINADINAIEQDLVNTNTKIQNYLISTFMFSRCR